MRTLLLSLTCIVFLVAPTYAQISAGDEPTGTTIIPFNIDLVLNNSNTTTSASLELDCDDQPEINVVLIQGFIAVDDPNYAQLEVIDPGLELCMDLAQFNSRPKYYTLGQLLDCSGSFDWQSNTTNVLGSYGGFINVGPSSVDNMYVAYRLNGEVGWIRLSFNLESGVSVQLQVHEALTLCGSTGVGDENASPALSLFPNPSDGEVIRVQSPGTVQGIEVLDAAGKIIALYGQGTRNIAAPEAEGIYFVRATFGDGRRSITKLVRN